MWKKRADPATTTRKAKGEKGEDEKMTEDNWSSSPFTVRRTRPLGSVPTNELLGANDTQIAEEYIRQGERSVPEACIALGKKYNSNLTSKPEFREYIRRRREEAFAASIPSTDELFSILGKAARGEIKDTKTVVDPRDTSKIKRLEVTVTASTRVSATKTLLDYRDRQQTRDELRASRESGDNPLEDILQQLRLGDDLGLDPIDTLDDDETADETTDTDDAGATDEHH